MTEKPDIYTMKLHERMTVWITDNRVETSGFEAYSIVCRVPGGWIYGETFVPYDDEFNDVPHVKDEYFHIPLDRARQTMLCELRITEQDMALLKYVKNKGLTPEKIDALEAMTTLVSVPHHPILEHLKDEVTREEIKSHLLSVPPEAFRALLIMEDVQRILGFSQEEFVKAVNSLLAPEIESVVNILREAIDHDQ